MKTFAYVITTVGMDCHDTRTYTDFLKNPETETYEFKEADMDNITLLYAEQLRDELIVSAQKENETIAVKATKEDIRSAIKKHQKFTIFGTDPETFCVAGETVTAYKTKLELQITNNSTFCFYTEYEGGQIRGHAEIFLEHVKDEDVRYVAVENFLCPSKYIPSVQRFYHEPFRDYAAFKAYFDNMELHHIQYCSSVKEMLIIDVSECQDSEWYQENMEIIRKIRENPKLSDIAYFQINAELHLETINQHT